MNFMNIIFLILTRIAPVFVFVADARFPFTVSSDQSTLYKEIQRAACVNISTLLTIIRVNYKFGILDRIIH